MMLILQTNSCMSKKAFVRYIEFNSTGPLAEKKQTAAAAEGGEEEVALISLLCTGTVRTALHVLHLG